MANKGEQLIGGEGGIRTPDTLASMPHFECGAFNHSATSPEPETGPEKPTNGRRYVTKRAKTDKGRGAYIAPSSSNPAMARRGDA
jgi:hypothetical protein